jgi:hypothetical protein
MSLTWTVDPPFLSLTPTYSSPPPPLPHILLTAAITDFMSLLGSQIKDAIQQGAKYTSAMQVSRRENIQKLVDPTSASASSTTDADTSVAALKRRLLMTVGDWQPGTLKEIAFDKASTMYTSVSEFLADVLGEGWRSIVPETWTKPTFTWEDLASFDFKTAVDDFISQANLENLTTPESLKDMYMSVETVETEFCTPEEYTAPEKVPATCAGPQVSLAYVPKTCVLNAADKVAICDPAKLVLTKTPGECTLKYKSAAEWTAKECKIEKMIGDENEVVLGGRIYTIPLGDIIHSPFP